MQFASPLTVIGPELPLAVAPPGDAVTVYEPIAAPPSPAGAEKLTVALPSPAAAVTPEGASGSPAGVTPLDADEAALVPIELVAVTVNV